MTTEMRRWLLPVETSWHEQALCRTRRVTAEMWRMFDPVDPEEEPKHVTWERARIAVDRYCVECPVMLQCAKEGAEHQYEGVWGGEFRERRGVVDLDTGLVVRGDLVEVNPDDLDGLIFDDADDEDDIELSEVVEPEPIELPVLAPAPEPTPEPAPSTRHRSRRPRRIGFRRPRRHRPPTIGVQLTLDDLGASRRRRASTRAVNDPAAGIRAAV